jgi:FkbM family methyltransferase
MTVSLDKSNPIGRIKYRLRWYLVTRWRLPGEIGLWAVPQVRLKIKRPETGNFVLRAQKRFGTRGNLLLYEPAETKVFLERVGRSAIFFDVGAHIGYYSLIAASTKNIQQVVAMEIFPGLANEINFHSEMNGFKHIWVENIAIGDSTTVIEFGNRTDRKKQKTISLDDYVTRTGLRPDLIKIDIEGFESLALDGAKETLSSAPELMLSVHPSFLTSYGSSVGELLDRLRERYAYIYLIGPEFDLEGNLPSAALIPVGPDRIPGEDFVLWCTRETILN